MCEPTTTTLMMMSIASTAASVVGQHQQMRAAEKANQAAYDNEMTALRYNQANNNFTRTQEAANLADQKVMNDQAARRAMSTATTRAGEGGVTGLSVDALLADLAGRAGTDNANAEVNYLRRDQAIAADNMGTWAKSASNINSLKTPQAPDYLGAALKIGTSVYDYNNPKVK
jgi:hypothetical protein